MELPAWTDRLERSLGEWSIPYLIRGIIGLNVLVWLMNSFSQTGDGSPSFAAFLFLHYDLVLKGEFWRVITFLFVPSVGNNMLSPLFLLFFVIFTWFISDILESTWGSFKVTLYFVIGVVSINIAAYLTGTAGTNLILMQSLLFSVAVLYPHIEITMLLIPIPIKLKWIAIISGAVLVFDFIRIPLFRPIILASLLPFALYIGPAAIAQFKQRREAQARMKRFRGED
ncbi:MAG: rhomboid family intramembrane serine protease [Verrucomicrobiota bacterium]